MERLHSLAVGAAVLLYILVSIPALGGKAANGPFSCCPAYNKEVARQQFCLIQSYSKISVCGSGEEAILFFHKNSGPYCANPKEDWVTKLQSFLDRQVKCKPRKKSPQRNAPSVEKRVGSASDGGSRSTEGTHLAKEAATHAIRSTEDPSTPALPNPSAQLDTEGPRFTPVTESTETDFVTTMHHVTGDCDPGISEPQGKTDPKQTSQECLRDALKDGEIAAMETHSSVVMPTVLGLSVAILVGVTCYFIQRKRGRKHQDGTCKDGKEIEMMALK
ncbi:uncharacterized protein [Heterodontus francisci]|uniref:uncharacterized protein isoform X2 n=1 Tax=Heterodontus francisci TaxID=7792 RepID=UPI00355B34DE